MKWRPYSMLKAAIFRGMRYADFPEVPIEGAFGFLRSEGVPEKEIPGQVADAFRFARIEADFERKSAKPGEPLYPVAPNRFAPSGPAVRS